ncbi:hypothetical protein bpr_II123 (plasmid) [Butyrivibrio proteoclasticus B316]|uniref:Uncharacterized protein n=1 Tax=Butyrivibrio proteoclasticus (strain ATCC 51982 / DSM 14932 / B316) TaxID=515622 RepID=E0S3T0_BUTPB|nr:hypothetical protein [Butyrivibrio proteoclasticus]ADL36062.1 hypothetical protein bpr_II123 [Butyrivibrio proteoclasticus B316]
MKIIKITTYGGMDWHDSTESSSYLTENGSYDIVDANKVIASYIHSRLLKFDKEVKDANSSPVPSVDELKQRIEDKMKICLNKRLQEYVDGSTGLKEGWYENTFCYDPEDQEIVVEYAGGQFEFHTYIDVKVIPDANVRYLAVENFLCPNKGVPSVERFYSYPVKKLQEAQRLLDELKLHEDMGRSEKYLMISDIDELATNSWYAGNITVINQERELEKLYEEDPRCAGDIPFAIYQTRHMDLLKKAEDEWFDKRRQMSSLAF